MTGNVTESRADSTPRPLTRGMARKHLLRTLMQHRNNPRILYRGDRHTKLTLGTAICANFKAVTLQALWIVQLGNVMWHMRDEQQRTLPAQRPREPAEHTEPVRSRRLGGPNASRTEPEQSLSRSGRGNPEATYFLTIEWFEVGHSRLAHRDQSHFRTAFLTEEEILMLPERISDTTSATSARAWMAGSDRRRDERRSLREASDAPGATAD